MDFPVVPGLTETAPDALPLSVKIAEVLASRPGGSSQHLADAQFHLEQAFKREENPKILGFIRDLLSDMRKGPQDRDGEESE
jgi:hypothetical protein